MQVPVAFRGQPTSQKSIADLPWWKLVKSGNLRRLLVSTYQNNRELRATVKNVDSAAQYVKAIAAPIFPFLDYGVATSRGNTSGSAKAASSLLTSASWEPDIWGKTRRSIEVAQADYVNADELMRSLQLSLLRQVSTSYLQLLMLDDQLRINREAVVSYRKSLDLFKVRFDAGVGDKLQVESANAALAAAEAQIPDIEAQIVALENTISVLAGRMPGRISRSGDSLSNYVRASQVPAGVPASVLAHRPDIRAAESKIRAANANLFPSINLTASYGLASSQLLSLGKTSDSWNFGANLTGPLFRAGVLTSGKKIAYNNLEAAVASYEQSVISAMAEISTTLNQRSKLKQIISKQEQAVTAYRQSLETSIQRYQNGLANYYEVLQAQQLLFPAEKQLASYRYQYAATLPTLYTQLGGGWKNTHAEVRSGGRN